MVVEVTIYDITGFSVLKRYFLRKFPKRGFNYKIQKPNDIGKAYVNKALNKNYGDIDWCTISVVPIKFEDEEIRN